MISDESSSDSETGRFKGSEKQDTKTSTKREDHFRSSARNRPGDRRNDRDRFSSREFDRRKDERHRYERRSREQPRPARHSPIGRRRYSRDRSLERKRRSTERYRRPNSRPRSKPRSISRDKNRHSRSMSHKGTDPQKTTKEKASVDDDQKARNRRSTSFEHKVKMSQVHKPIASVPSKKAVSPIQVIDEAESDVSEGTQPASYYSLIPIVKDKPKPDSVTDSSDDERLRAKLLNLEKELDKTKRKKHKKKHKKKISKCKTKDKDKDASASVEVTSTTDIQEENEPDPTANIQADVEVTSTQTKGNQKESSEEGEITSDESAKAEMDIDPSDLRHKLKRTAVTAVERGHSPDLREVLKAKHDVCGPALPPHLEKKFRRSVSSDVEEVEGPALPPHLKSQDKNKGPSIPTEMRKVLADVDHTAIKYESSEEDQGIGPVPAGPPDALSEAHQQLEERALSMKIKQIDGHSLKGSDVKSREQWMLELPEGKTKYLGLEARSFRAKEGPDLSDRSSWTDTPEEKARKAAGLPAAEGDSSAALQTEARARHIADRDAEHEKAVKKHKKKHKREESLLEMHEKKLKKKKKKEEKEEGKKERRPFDRDVDLQANRFDEAQKKAIIKKAQHLDTRFSAGEAKYL